MSGTKYKVQAGVIQLPTLYGTLKASEQDPELKNSVFSQPAEWLQHLILNPNAPTETKEYVLLDAGNKDKVPKQSRSARLFNPTERRIDKGKEIVVAQVYDIPFKLTDSKYNPEDLDPKTGFLRKLSPDGKYAIVFGEDNRLYAAFLYWYGRVSCNWVPSSSGVSVGLRGSSTGNLPPELLENEVDVLRATLERERAGHEKYKAEIGKELAGIRSDFLTKIETVEKRLQGK